MQLFGRKLESGHAEDGDILIFTFGLIALIFGVRMLFEGIDWIPESIIAFIISTPFLLYGISYRLIKIQNDEVVD